MNRDTNSIEVESEKQEWDDVAEFFRQVHECNTLQTNVVLYNLARVRDATKICEVGAGVGIAPRVLANSIMTTGFSLFTSDISKNMVKGLKKKFDSEHMSIEGKIKATVLEEFGDEIDVDSIICNEADTREVFIHEADSEKLPYPSNCFERYISNLCLFAVGDYKQALKESYRVLQKDGIAAFAVIGRRENDSYWKLVFDAFKAIGIEDADFQKDPHYLGDRDALKKDFEEVGYKNIKMAYVSVNLCFTPNEAYYFSSETPFVLHLHEKLSAEDKIKYEDEFMRLFEENFGSEVFDFPQVEVLMALGQK